MIKVSRGHITCTYISVLLVAITLSKFLGYVENGFHDILYVFMEIVYWVQPSFFHKIFRTENGEDINDE